MNDAEVENKIEQECFNLMRHEMREGGITVAVVTQRHSSKH